MNMRQLTTTTAAVGVGLLAGMPAARAASALEEALHWKLDRAGYLRQYETVFRQPIREGGNAVAVGNGDLAAVGWQPEHLTWMLNKCDISGNASQAARLTIETPQPLTARIGTLETRLSLAEATMTVTYEGGKLPEESGWVWRGKSGPQPKVTDADQGTVRATAYVPEGRNVFLLSYAETAKVAHPLTFVLERWLQPELGGKLTARVEGNTLALVYSDFKDNAGYAQSYAAVLAYDGFAGAVPAKVSETRATLTLPTGTSLSGRLAIAVVTSLEAADPLAAATQLATATLKEEEAKLRAAHLSYWSAFWDALFVDAGHPYLNALYHVSLYELGISSRGKRPVKFNGALNLWSEKARTWGAGYWCHNQSESYLQCYTANHAELADNFHDWIARVRPEAVKAARQKFQVDGAYYPEVMGYDFAVPDPNKPAKPAGMDYILSSGVRYALMLWNRYQYTLDEAFLRDKAYPVICDCAEFYVNYTKKGADGRYHCAPGMSWEEHPLGRDSHADVAAMRAIFPIAIEAGTRLKLDTDKLPAWREHLEQAPAFPVADGLFSVVIRDDGTPEPTNHYQWQMPNLSAVFPYGVIGAESAPELRRLAEDTFSRYRFNADAGHEFLPVIAARLGNAEWWRAAMYQYVQFFQCYEQGLFHYYNLAGQRELGGVAVAEHHPYLEASGIMATAVNEMLLQSYDGTLRVFPATPERWPARFILRAAGSFLVASEHRGREGIPGIAIQAVGGTVRPCRVAVPWPQGAELFSAGRAVKFKTVDGKALFEAKPGAVYLLLPKGAKAEALPTASVGFTRSFSPCRVGNAWYGRRDTTNSHSGDFPLW